MSRKSNDKLIIILTVVLFVVLLYFCFNLFRLLEYKKSKALATSSDEEVVEILENENPIKIEKIIKQNKYIETREEMIYEKQDLEYNTKYVKNDKLPSGTIQVSQLGVTGLQDVITIKKFQGDDLISEQIVANNIIKAPIDKIIEIGTGRGINSYTLKTGDTVYSTPTSLSIMFEPDFNSEKLTTISKGEEVKVLEILDNGWSYIYSSHIHGYVLSEGLSNINPLKDPDEIDNNKNNFTKEELLAKLSFDMDVGEPSGLSLEQFRKILSGNSSDKNKIFEENCDYFYYAEQEYGINGVFLASLAIHESGWGTSKIALNKKNLFGYQAYDSSPYSSAKEFSSYSEGIDFVARILIKYYLNSKGTEIYGGDVADGRYFEGYTIKSVNVHYASDPNWANAIYNIMVKIYNNL